MVASRQAERISHYEALPRLHNENGHRFLTVPGAGSLVSDVQAIYQSCVAPGVVLAQVVQQLPALCDHAQKSARRTDVLAMLLEVLSEICDSGCEHSHLYFDRAGVAVFAGEICNDLVLFFFADGHFLLSCDSVGGAAGLQPPTPPFQTRVPRVRVGAEYSDELPTPPQAADGDFCPEIALQGRWRRHFADHPGSQVGQQALEAGVGV